MRLRWLRALFLEPNASPTLGQVGLGSLMECQKCKTQWRRAIFKPNDGGDFQVVGTTFHALLIEEGSSRSGAHFSLLADDAREFATLVTPRRSCWLLLGEFVALPSSTPKAPAAYTSFDGEEGLPTLTFRPFPLALSGEVRKEQHRSVKKVDECNACLFERAVEQGVPLVSGNFTFAFVVKDNKLWVPPDELGVVKSDIDVPQTMTVAYQLDFKWAKCSVYMMGREVQDAYLDAPYDMVTVVIKPGGFLEIYYKETLHFQVKNHQDEQMILNIVI